MENFGAHVGVGHAIDRGTCYSSSPFCLEVEFPEVDYLEY